MSTNNLIHDEGSMFGEVSGLGGSEEMPWFIEKRDDEFCVVKGTREHPIETEKCHATNELAKTHMAALFASEEKAIEKRSDKPGDFLVVEDREKPTTWHLQVRRNGKVDHNLMGGAWAALHKGFRGNKYEGPDKAGALRRLIALYKSEDMPTPGAKEIDEFKPSFMVYKSADGSMRWASVSSTAIKDKEFEVVTERAYDDAIQHAKDTKEFGVLDLVHVDGTDVGDADLMLRADKRLIEGGTFRDTPMAANAIKAVQDDPDHWGVSIEFVFDPSKFDGEKYNGNIRIQKRAILPQEMAAAYGTRFIAIGGKSSMSEELKKDTREALAKLGISEDEIEALAEKQVAQPENVKTKEEDAPATKSVWDKLRDLLARAEKEEPGVETGDAEDTQEEPEMTKAQLDESAIKVMAETVATAMAGKMAEQFEQITALSATISDFDARLKQAEEAVEDKVLSRLADLPQIVKVRATETDVLVVEEPAPQSPLPQQGFDTTKYVERMIAGVKSAVDQALVPVTKVQV